MSGLNFSFGAKPASSLGAPAPGLGATTSGSGGLNFGSSGFGSSTGFGLTPATATNSASGLNFGSSANSTGPSTNFGFSSLSSAAGASSGLNFKSTAAAPAQGLGSTFSALGGLSNAQTKSNALSFGSVSSSQAFSNQTPTVSSLGMKSSLTMPMLGMNIGQLGSVSTVPTSSVTTLGTQGKVTFRDLEKSVNDWSKELEDQERSFLEQATRVNAWDKVVSENASQITQLNASVDKLKLEQGRVDVQLDFIRAQQKELDEILQDLQKSTETSGALSQQAQMCDTEREDTYRLAESLDTQLRAVGAGVAEVVEHLNAGVRAEDDAQPLGAIERILNAHLDLLNWIDTNTNLVQKRVSSMKDQLAKV